jgi:hypothetical protein
MTSDESVCPVCEQSVDTVVRRHKTLGVFVPVWGPGPCRNPRCARHEAGEENAGPGTEPVLTAPAAGTESVRPARPVRTAEPAPPEKPRAGPERDL